MLEETINLWSNVQEEEATTTEQTEETTEECVECEEVESDSAETEELADESQEPDEESEGEESAKSEAKPKELSQYERIILADMERRAKEGDELLATALQSKDKSIQSCFAYVKERARKLAVSGCAMIEDAIVFGWAHHYYIESKETIDAETKTASKAKSKEKTAEQKKAEENKKKVFENPLLASLMKKGAKIAEGEVAVTKTSTKKDAEGNVLSSKTTKTDADGTTTTTLVKEGKTYTLTEFSLF